jgi:hypothetical protein
MVRNSKAKGGGEVSTAAVSNTSQSFTVSFVLTLPKGAKPTYTNFVEVVQTAHDFTMTGAQMPVKLSEEQLMVAGEGKRLPIEADFQITFPVSLLVGLIDALMLQKEAYEKVNNLTLKDVRPPAGKKVAAGEIITH